MTHLQLFNCDGLLTEDQKSYLYLVFFTVNLFVFLILLIAFVSIRANRGLNVGLSSISHASKSSLPTAEHPENQTSAS